MAIIIPAKLHKRLKDDNNKWQRRVENLIDTLEPILGHSPEFFPQYTDHGLSHVNTVLELAAELIHSKSLGKNALTSRDVACLVAAILIHDLGMFLTPGGLTMLMMQEWDQHRLQALDELSWSDAWEQYIASAKRLPTEQMLRCFGKQIRVEETTLNKEKMVQNDKLVIGEFLRRNHPRLAYEIAVSGLPGSTLQKILEASGFDKTDCSIIGLIARSHGMSLREVEDYLGPNAYYSNLPVYYLMSILRLADYLDASEKRAPMVRLNQEALTSPLSKEEWALNQRFKIDSSRWYPESKNYTIDATPKTSSEYARLEKWLMGVQSELDQCWAILAEKYPNSKLKLSIHRIKCTMYEKLNYSNLSSSILPREVKVTANPEIVKLMMEPLYGDDPTYGVRELLQNAVDACLERKKWEEDHGNSDYKGLVDIRIENGTFTITDNGMGMNEDVLLNYYLSAGSSYRDSDDWKAANAPDGNSRVARTGKFGVGFLAAFLLGNEIEVQTQHINDQLGYHFKFTQESMPLDVLRKKRTNPYATDVNNLSHAGTTITINLKATAIRGFNSNNYNYPWYNWYAFDEPKVRYFIDGTELHHEKLCLHRDPTKNESWLTLPSGNFEVLQWKPDLQNLGSEFYCNGIRIYKRPIYMGKLGIPYSDPHVSVIDQNSSLAVDLARQTVKSFSHSDALVQEMLRWQIAYLLLVPWNDESDFRKNCNWGFSWVADLSLNTPFLLSRNGFSLNHAATLPVLNLKDHVFLYYSGEPLPSPTMNPNEFLLENTPYCIVTSDWGSPKDLILDLLGHYNGRRFSRHALYYDVDNLSAAVWIREDIKDDISNRQRDEVGLTKFVLKGDIYTAHCTHRPSQMPIDLQKFSIEEFPVAVHVKASSDSITFRQHADSLFTRTLKEVLIPAPDYQDQDLWIPFDMEERKKKFSKAFENLKVYMDHIRKYPPE